MNKREKLQALLAGEKQEETLQWLMSLTSMENAKKLMPEELLYEGYSLYPGDGSYPFAPMGETLLGKQAEFNEYIDRCAFPVGWGANAAFGHSGPGEFKAAVTEKTEDYFLAEYETGVKWKINLKPYYVQLYGHPVANEEDFERLVLPDPHDQKRYEGFREDTAWAKCHGQWTIGFVNGIFSSVHYFFREYQEFLMDLVTEEAFAAAMVKKAAEWTITAAENMCKAGVDCIGFCDDLGSGTSMLISPDSYRRLIWPWHKELCDTVHSYGAVVHMHSHGAIMPVVKELAEAGVDILNPVDPDDRMPMKEVRDAAGPRMVLCGGMDKHFFDWDRGLQAEYLEKTIRDGRELGPHILMDSGGVPDNVDREWFGWFLETSRSLRKCR